MISSAIFPVLLLLLRLSGLKVVVTMHGVVPRKLVNAQFAEAFFIPERFVALNLGLTFMTILMCKLANIVIVHNGFAKDTLYKDYEVSLQKILVIPHGIGVSDPENLNFSLEKCNSVLFFGNITPSKGLETLIAAFERVRVPNVKLIIAGGPHPRGMNYFLRIAKMVRSSPVAKKIALTGYISDERIHFLFSQCSMAVFPYIFSVSSSGGLSFALQHLKPTVVTALPVFTETIIHQQNGLVVPASDSEALAEAIELLLLNDDVRHRLSRGIAENSSNLDWSVVATRTYEAYLHAFLNS
jgi:glycosyltransferase involved in cell wall biosynthesis